MRRLYAVLLLLAALAPRPAAASLALADSFRIGNAGVLCTAQSRVADPSLRNLFDRGYRIVCRDAATPVGRLLALRIDGDRAAALRGTRADGIACDAPTPATLAGVGAIEAARCQQGALAWSVLSVRRGRTLFVAEGLAGYGTALRLGLASLVTDAPAAGVVDVAVTEAGDPAAFARVQAGNLDPTQALAEGYVRNNAGSFAESAAFFDLLVERSRQGAAGFGRSAEYLAGQALQQSNLGNFAEADQLFGRARAALDPSDPVVPRLYRNFRAMHLLNQRQPEAARAALASLASGAAAGLDIDRVAAGYIDAPLAQRLSGDETGLRRLGGGGGPLSPEERAGILDAQALYLAGAAARMTGDDAAARRLYGQALAALGQVRSGRVISTSWLRAGIATDRAIIEERAGDAAAARASLTEAAAIFARDYPESAAMLVARARLAGLLARQGDAEGAASLYRGIVAAAPATPGAGPAVRPLLAPWFALLVARGDAGANDFFDASQILVRPGVAQTQAVLARELSGGSDAAASLFRQSLALSREIIRVEAEIARLVDAAGSDAAVLTTLRARREALGGDQTAVLARLAEFPRYRSLSNDVVTLATLQAALRPGEAYYKLILVGETPYALFAGHDSARILAVGATAAELGAMVKTLRDSIVVFEGGRPATYPFDALTARRLYRLLFDGVDSALAEVRHLVFEPDGALLQLPANLLIARDTGLADFQRRLDSDDGDPFDMRGLAWLGRDRMVSTAVSPRAFLDVRALGASKGGRAYLGLGENAVPASLRPAAATVTAAPAGAGRAAATRGSGGALAGAALTATPPGAAAAFAGPVAAALPARDPCDWPLAEWAKPISPAELRIGARLLGAGGDDVVTGGAFSDTALKARSDLRQYRVIHFATHGLVTAPRPECPATPALLTSFGDTGSDGLLSFREIFDLSLDADTIILSACDTAGGASAAATRDAGIATGGSFALDGLVRAFVGAGARAVIASHWPVPDNFDATTTLITGLFSDAGAMSVGEALRASQMRLMDRAETSHPYYWAGFAIVGDAAKPLTAARSSAALVAAAPAAN
ncbi:hypothetical protein IP88_01105 [alpha proteobacterium AAP81b]|nr:hypothetical protein IP88_01105 [alpha proteobacterium AAP81b]